VDDNENADKRNRNYFFCYNKRRGFRIADHLGSGKVSADERKRSSEDSADLMIRHAYNGGSRAVSADGRKRHSEESADMRIRNGDHVGSGELSSNGRNTAKTKLI
jgi:hypothetical protein